MSLSGLDLTEMLDAVKSLEEALNCSACKKLLDDPVLFVMCGHTACKCCFSNSCPVCGTPVNNKDSIEKVKENTEFKIILKELNVLRNVLKDVKISMKENVPTESNEQSNVQSEKIVSLEDQETSGLQQYSTPINTKKVSSKTKSEKISLKENSGHTESTSLNEQLNVLSEKTRLPEDKETATPLRGSIRKNTRKRSSSEAKNEEANLKKNGVSSKSDKQSPMLSGETASHEIKETQFPLQCSTPKNTRKRSSSRNCSKFSCCETIKEKAPLNQSDISNSSIQKGRKKSDVRKPTASRCPDTSLSLPSPASNLNKKNAKGETLLHRAVIRGDIAKVKEFIKQGASVNTQDNNGWTPLHEASNHGFFDIAKLLLDHGALVNVPSLKDNITPLHDALLNDKLDIAILLASRGADLHAKASFGYCALDLCKTDKSRRSLTEACSPFIEANTIMPISKNTDIESDKVVFLYSNLNDEQKIKLQKCAQLLKAEIVEDFKPNVTHVVTSCDNMGNCTRTMKILLGMLSGKWLINFQWVEVCLEYKRKVEEEVFEVQGTKNQPNTQAPTRARNNILQKFPPLFDGIYFYLHGTFTKPTPLREDLCNLIHMGGGKLLSREPKPDVVSSEAFMMPYHAAGTPLESINHIILYQDKPPRNVHLNSDHICTTQVMWLISCINEYSLLPPKQTNAAD